MVPWINHHDEGPRIDTVVEVAVTNSGCIGPCGSGPNVLVYPEGVFYGGVTKEDVSEIYDSHLLGDAPVTRLQVDEEIWG